MVSGSGVPNEQEFLEALRHQRLCAIVRASSAEVAERLAGLVVAAGVGIVEVALTTPEAVDVIGRLRTSFPDALVGAGTVLSANDVRRVVDAGAQFAVTPGGVDQVGSCSAAGLPVLAGALTPAEVLAVRAAGASAVKLFPASLGGPGLLRALRDPLPDVPFVPVGGVTLDSLDDWFAAGAVAVGAGGPLVGKGTEADAEIAERARRFVAACRR